MAKHQITGTAEYGALLFMAPMNAFAPKDRKQFGPFESMTELKNFYNAEKVEPYEEMVSTPVGRNPEDSTVIYEDKPVTKNFKKNGPLEWMYPLEDDQWVDGTEGNQLSMFGHGAVEGLINIEVVNKRDAVFDPVPEVIKLTRQARDLRYPPVGHDRVNFEKDFEAFNERARKLSGQFDAIQENEALQDVVEYALEVSTVGIAIAAKNSEPGTTTLAVKCWNLLWEIVCKAGRLYFHIELLKIQSPNDLQRWLIKKFFSNDDDAIAKLFSTDIKEFARDVFPDMDEDDFHWLYWLEYDEKSGEWLSIGDSRMEHLKKEDWRPVTIGELRVNLLMLEHDYPGGASAVKAYNKWLSNQPESVIYGSSDLTATSEDGFMFPSVK